METTLFWYFLNPNDHQQHAQCTPSPWAPRKCCSFAYEPEGSTACLIESNLGHALLTPAGMKQSSCPPFIYLWKPLHRPCPFSCAACFLTSCERARKIRAVWLIAKEGAIPSYELWQVYQRYYARLIIPRPSWISFISARTIIPAKL